jgi:DNA-binding IclR family transcriptional regulator
MTTRQIADWMGCAPSTAWKLVTELKANSPVRLRKAKGKYYMPDVLAALDATADA